MMQTEKEIVAPYGAPNTARLHHPEWQAAMEWPTLNYESSAIHPQKHDHWFSFIPNRVHLRFVCRM
jgi:hypothetical protein